MDWLVVACRNNLHPVGPVSLECVEMTYIHRKGVHETFFNVPIRSRVIEDVDNRYGRFGNRISRFIVVLFAKLNAVSSDGKDCVAELTCSVILSRRPRALPMMALTSSFPIIIS
jgi:hypothetical protein